MKTNFMTGIQKTSTLRNGFTLIETMISIGIFMILVTIAVGGFIQAIHTQGEVGTLISTQSNVSSAMEEMAREIRTGYLFCHGLATTTISDACGGPSACHVGLSKYLSPSGYLPTWTCPALDFYNANSGHVTYSLDPSGSELLRTDSQAGDTPQPLLSSNVKVKYLKFEMFGNIEGDTWPPRITIIMGVAPSSTDPAISTNILNFETTVSGRQMDCSSGPNATNPPC